jgi:hypothetical protein
MKKFLLSAAAILFAFAVIAQQRTQLPKEIVNQSSETEVIVPAKEYFPLNNTINNTVQSRGLAPIEEEIGGTWYDLQSNATLGNRFQRWDDGTMAAVWTQGYNTPPGFPDRGAGYNYFNGTTWGPIPTPGQIVEDVRSGWPSIAALGENGEIVVSHGGTPFGINVYTRANKGTGPWIKSSLPNPAGRELTWPRVATSGENNMIVHVVAADQNSANPAENWVYYNRSTDGGVTWSGWDYPPLVDLDFYTFSISADDYLIATRGDNVVIQFSSQTFDLFFIKSTDNGETWEKTVVWEHPYPQFSFSTTPINDTLWTPDNSHSVAIDNNGMAHIVFGLFRWMNTDPGSGSYQVWWYTDGIAYWNEYMEPFENDPLDIHRTLHFDSLYATGNVIGWLQDVNGDGQINIFDLELMNYRSLGLSTMPAIHVDDINRVFVIYSETTETFDDGTHYYKKLWARASPDGGTTWGDFMHITDDIMHMFDECIYPQLAATSDDYIYYHYNADETPGIALDDDHPYQLNRIIFGKLAKPEIVGTNDPVIHSSFKVHQNFPNPVHSTTQFIIELPVRTQVSVEVYNLVGQKVVENNMGFMNTGKHLIQLDMANFTPGMYFYTVKAGNKIVTHKMMVK